MADQLHDLFVAGEHERAVEDGLDELRSESAVQPGKALRPKDPLGELQVVRRLGRLGGLRVGAQDLLRERQESSHSLRKRPGEEEQEELVLLRLEGFDKVMRDMRIVG